MPSMFRKAINAVKDQTSITMFKLSANYLGEYCNLEATILKATSHEEEIPDERYIARVIAMVVSSTKSASSCVQALSRRILRTRDYVVALKSLILIFHGLREGGLYFSLEAKELRVSPGGRRFLDMSNFSTSLSYSSTPWDYTAFVRTYARYLDTRLESAIQGKLRNLNFHGRMAINLINSMTPSIAFVHIEHWQRLLGRAISMKPTGTTCNNRLVQLALYMVVRETFDLYRDISASLNLLLDKFFSMDKKCRIKTVKSCHAAMKQFEELDSFYALCMKIDVGKITEYPHVQMISKTLVKSLGEYLLDANVNDNASSLESSPQSLPRMSFQAPVICKSGELMSDSHSIMSEPVTNHKKKTFAIQDDKKHPTPSALKLFNRRKETTRVSNLPKWEHLLLETAISNSENGSLYSQEIKMVDDHTRSCPENYHNPFLQGSINKTGNKNAANELDRTPTVRSDDASSSNNSARALSASTRQKLILQEQRRWREQQEEFFKVMWEMK